MGDKNRLRDSAGVPWEGRELKANPHSDDDGSADSRLIQALSSFRLGLASIQEVIQAFTQARLLVPLVAHLSEEDNGPQGLKVDKTAELSIVTVQAPDGQNALPVFSSVATMATWNKSARPVPNTARAIALAAASEGSTRIVLDPMSETEFVLRRPLIAAVAQNLPWQPPETSSHVRNAVNAITQKVPEVIDFVLSSGDPRYQLVGQELNIQIQLVAGLSQTQLRGIEADIFRKLADNEEFVALVDSVSVQFLPN